MTPPKNTQRSKADEIPTDAEAEPTAENDVEPEPAPEPVEFRFAHDEDEAVLTLSVRGGHEVVLAAGEAYSTVDRHEIRALDAHEHVERVNA